MYFWLFRRVIKTQWAIARSKGFSPSLPAPSLSFFPFFFFLFIFSYFVLFYFILFISVLFGKKSQSILLKSQSDLQKEPTAKMALGSATDTVGRGLQAAVGPTPLSQILDLLKNLFRVYWALSFQALCSCFGGPQHFGQLSPVSSQQNKCLKPNQM